ncbi:type IV secretory system conjugative DNA transfer family protein [Rhodococcus ruber]|uniref:type IV secretory system conjugative DNA transfer family protein n=1 Tax=Rhodococcus ruber TaxID=1830 RepID=UPI000C7C8029|nr:DUF87 domain-containing protein [Rhodococcus ruber]AUM20237.1 ATP-binding protein [Rhodococcus ruber]
MGEHFDIRENHEGSAQWTASLLALRQHDEGRATKLRGEIPLLLGRMCAEAPGTSLELSVSGQPSGVVTIDVHVAGPADSATQWCTEAAVVLDQIAEVEQSCRIPSKRQQVWPIVPVRTVPLLGYSIDPPCDLNRKASAPVMWHAPSQIHARFAKHPVWAEVAAAHLRYGLRVRVTPAEARTQPDLWDVQLAVLTAGDPPSLRLRSQIRELLPGLQIATQASVVPVAVRVDAGQLPVLFAVPIAGTTPVNGTYAAAAAPIPMYPTRDRSSAVRNGLRLGLGHTESRARIPVRLRPAEQLRHVHVLGRTGTGKSSLLAGAAYSIAQEGAGMLVLDPHGHLIDRILAELPNDAIDRTRVIRSGDIEHPVPLNPLAVTDAVARDLAIDETCAMFEYLFDKKQNGVAGPRFRERVGMALRALTTVHGSTASLLDVPIALSEDGFLKRAVAASGDARLAAWYANEVRNRRSNDYGDLVSWVNSKFEAFTATAAMRAILGSGIDAFDMAEAMDTHQIVLVDLSKSHLGESASRLLGYLHLNRVWSAGLRRTGARPFTVIVDEVHSMVSGSLTSMLSEGRKFGLSVIMAHQYLDQLDEDLRPAVDGNVATTVAFRCAVSDAAAIVHRFGGQVDPATLMTLPDLSAVILRSAAGGMARPHTLTVDHNDRNYVRTGTELEHLTTLVTDRTRREWSDPHAEATRRARDGYSQVCTIEPAEETSTAPLAGKASFLDDWLARRQQDVSESA